MQRNNLIHVDNFLNDVRDKLGYRVQKYGDLGDLLHWLNWQVRTLDTVFRPIISLYDEYKILEGALRLINVVVGHRHEGFSLSDYASVNVKPEDAEIFTELFRTGMQTYLTERPYVTKPKQALEKAVEAMKETAKPKSA